MTAFSADWLALREPFDQAARETAAAQLDWPSFVARLKTMTPPDAPLEVLDLGCGTGANLRALALRLGERQRWRLVDHDPALLAAVPLALAPWAAAQGLTLRTDGEHLRLQGEGLQIDIARQQQDLVAGLADLPFEGASLVTGAALLDLASAAWADALIARCRAAGVAVYWALTVDDRLTWLPPHADDAPVRAAFEAHQRRDKGFGPALGGAAVGQVQRCLQAAGYTVAAAPSDWVIDTRRGPTHRALFDAMTDGIAAAAMEQTPADAPLIADWQTARHAGGAQLRVGHMELMGWLSPD